MSIRFFTYIIVFLILSSCTVLNTRKATIVEELKESPVADSNNLDDCGYIFNGMDYRINQHRRETTYQELFSFTHKKLKSYYNKEHFMECYSSMAQLGETRYLYLKIFFNSSEAAKSYGSIVKGENLRITLMNGEKLFMEALSTSNPKKSKTKNKIVFDAIFSMSSTDLLELSKTEINFLGIIWAQGYEEYDIQNIDLLKNQAECLKRKLP